MLNCNSFTSYKRFLSFGKNLLFQQFMVNYRVNKPDCETRNHGDTERDVFLETYQCGNIKENARENSPVLKILNTNI